LKWLAIANPAAGRPRQVQRAVAELARLPDFPCEVAETRGPGDATRIAREARGFDGFVAVGGDGTIGEVINGMALDRQVLAVLPAGHGNCLARDLGLGCLIQSLNALRRARVESLDLLETRILFRDGVEERRWCASTLAAGYVTDVVTMGRTRLAWMGEVAYAAAAMVTMPRAFMVSFSSSSELQRRTGVVINNTMYLSNFRGLPDASVRDGLLDVMELTSGWPRQLLHNLSVLAGSRRFGPLAMRQVTSVGLDFDEPRTIMADGELRPSVVRLHVKCCAAAARCVVGGA
jgi:diacylglycerol kinase family enzyme